MLLKTTKTPLLFLVFGTCWALISDPVITLLARQHTFGIQDSIRGFNDLIFVLMATALLYLQIKKEQKNLQISEKQYRTLFMANPNPMWIYQVGSNKFIEVNEAAIQKYGYSRKEFLKMTIMDIRPEKDFEKLKEAIKMGETYVSDGAVWEHITRSGEIIIVSISSHRLTFNNRKCSMVMVTDVTEVINSKQKLEKALEKEKLLNEKLEENINLTKIALDESHKMAEVIDKISNLVVIIDMNGFVLWVNRAFSDFTEYSPSDIIGKKPPELFYGPDTDPATANSLHQALSEKKPVRAEIVNYKKNGQKYWTQLYISPIFDRDDNLDFFVSVESIVTEQKEKEERLNQHYRAFREIAWANSHRIRKPLASILSLMALLKDTENKDEQNELLGMIEVCSLEMDLVIKENARKINAIEQTV